jgi:hypothetical protein
MSDLYVSFLGIEKDCISGIGGSFVKRFKSTFSRRVLVVLAILIVLFFGGIWGMKSYFFVRDAGVNNDTPISVEVSLDKEIANIGDEIQYRISVVASSDVEVKLPLPGEKLGDMTVHTYSGISTRSVWGISSYEQIYKLITYETGEYILPSPDIVYIAPGGDERIIAGNDVLITIKSLLLEAEGELDIKAIKSLTAPPREYRPFVFTALGLIGLAVIATSISRAIIFRQAMDFSELCITRPAHEFAYEELERARDLLNTGFIERFYVRISECVRKYLENRFQMNAMEMATEEFLVVAQGTEDLYEHKELLGAFLSNCDLVKFARYPASEEDAWKAYYSAKRLIDETKDTSEVSIEQVNNG